MKASNDPRHQRRRTVARQLFALMFAPDQEVEEQVKGIWAKKEEIDNLITEHAPEWPLNKLNRTDLAILQLAVYELKIEKKEPIKVVIDEAVELAKEMGSENSPAFINGVLGSIIKGDPRLEEKEVL
ncbi:MAG: transcription antitermination factor NusB [Candidatus Blackburnbacteria bacterium RIFCSPHIGHO2_01_FULL_43_15b]|uniref:Transcription antitermination protein NusB n=1 Tax=Candidatus Blackburnbacteria bacterium RIFCSPHIGHO2_01_FULL_43_15b TaxID=1797513 RepID=A0A1G1UXL5_9BACT|nr:MAG: transcription antitermination factor NusB [Candidatus Blackburnbacteria bacterium RIFCSPHIGHO2_01_FULL_43_15b]